MALLDHPATFVFCITRVSLALGKERGREREGGGEERGGERARAHKHMSMCISTH